MMGDHKGKTFRRAALACLVAVTGCSVMAEGADMAAGQTTVIARYRDCEVLVTKSTYNTIRWVRCESSRVVIQ